MAQQAEDYGCHPYEEIKKAHDDTHGGSEPKEPETTTTEKLMRPQKTGQVEE
jgi:hypothetical protein